MGKEITVNSFSKYRLDRAKQEYQVAIYYIKKINY